MPIQSPVEPGHPLLKGVATEKQRRPQRAHKNGATMLLIRRFRIAALLLLALFVAGCASTRPEPQPAPAEIYSYSGEIREDNFVNPDGLNIFGRYWLPDGDPRAVLVLVHGTIMHSGLYDEMGRYLAARGYAVYGIDLQGWGRSDGIGKRGDVYNHDAYVSDVALLLDRMRSEFPDRPVFAFGESLGGIVLLLGHAQRRFYFDGLVLSAPGFKPNPRLPGGFHAPDIAVKWGMGIAGWFGSKMPTWPTVPVDPGMYYMFRHDKGMRDALLEDPYVAHNWLPARYITAIADANKFLEQRFEVVNVPMLLLHGDKDELIPVDSSRELARRTLGRDKTLKVFKGMGHAIMLQPERYEGMMIIRDWLDNRTAPRGQIQADMDASELMPLR
jgi:acylglycerol lipase